VAAWNVSLLIIAGVISGGASPHSLEMWLRAEKSNGRAMAWGNEHGQGKVVMHFQSPPHVKMECYFSGADVSTSGRLPMNEWIHVVHTYQQGDSRVYVNGELSGVSARSNSPLAIKTPARLWIGGWYHNYDFVGDIDEVRVSKVMRSADWVKLQYENQKAQQTLVGPLVQPGNTFAVSPEKVAVEEGKSVAFTAQAGGAQKILWLLKRDGREEGSHEHPLCPPSANGFPTTMRSQAATCSTSTPSPASRSRSSAKTVPSSSSIPAEATESAAPEKAAAEKMLGTAERIAMFANNA